MSPVKTALLTPDEHVIDEITATFEVKETLGVTYKFGHLIATNKALKFYTKYPLIWTRETAIYHYDDIIGIDRGKSLLLFTNGDAIAVKLVNKGHASLFVKVVEAFADRTSDISDVGM